MKTRIGQGLLVVVAMVFVAGCSGLQCWYGECDSLPNESYTAQVASKSANTAELQTALKRVAEYYAVLVEQTKPFGGMYANAAYSKIVREGAALSAEIAQRAERGDMTPEEMSGALEKFAAHLMRLEAGCQGTR